MLKTGISKNPKIVLLGAGTGQAQVLRSLRDKPAVAIVGVTDSGGHSGRLRKLFGIPAVGDLRNCIAALAESRRPWGTLLGWRFTEGDLDGVSLGNLLLASLVRSTGSLSRAAEALQAALGTPARALPVSDADAQVCARLASGKTLIGEWNILMRKDRSPIHSVFHRPAIRACARATRAVAQSGLIVLCPGTLYTGVLSCATAEGLPQAIRRSRGRLVQILNIMTQPGQTDGMGASAHVEAVSRALGRRPDLVIVNTGEPLPSHARLYARLGARPVVDDLTGPGILRGDFVLRDGDERQVARGQAIPSLPHLIRHDPARLRRALLRLT